MLYRYDGTFDGLLTVIATARETGSAPHTILPDTDHSGELFCTEQSVRTDRTRSAATRADLIDRAGRDCMQVLALVFLSDLSGREMDAYRFYTVAMERGACCLEMLMVPAVARALEISRKVRREAHRMKGLLRFFDHASGYRYAPMQPEYNVLPLILSHCVARFADHDWVIHDTKRNSCAIYHAGEQRATYYASAPDTFRDGERKESLDESLWRTYVRAVAIPERENKRLQRSHMPKKYWRYLPEMDQSDRQKIPR